MPFTAFKKKLMLCLPSPPLALIDGPLINAVCEAEWRRNRSAITHVLHYKAGPDGPAAGHESSMPGEPDHVSSGHYKTMLKRYLFAGSFFCRGKRVIDSCCGLGWGAFLLAQHSGSVVAFDRSAQSLAFCRGAWETSHVT